MILDKIAHYNDLSEKLRTELEERVRSFGKSARYKFNISHVNPDPQKYNGPTIWPFIYTLDPTIFRITDKNESDKTKSKSKLIALIEGTDDKGLPNKFRKIRVRERHQGIVALQLDVEEEFDMAMFLELHPKNANGMFPDKTKQQVFSRVDEKSYAETQRKERTARKKALDAAEEMSEKNIIDFADAMMWDSTEDIELLKNKVEELAETNPVFFNDIVAGKNIEYQAVVKQALDRQVISFDPAEYKFIWTSNQQSITVLQATDNKNHVEKLAEWFQIGGKQAQDVYKRLKGMVKTEPSLTS